MPTPQEFHDSTLYLIRAETAVAISTKDIKSTKRKGKGLAVLNPYLIIIDFYFAKFTQI
jgi:hypothetical protein